MAHWVRYQRSGAAGFGTLEGDTIAVHSGDMFNGATPTGERIALSEVDLLAPTEPTKVIALWNNFHALAAKINSPVPADPLYLLKAGSCLTSPGATVHRPASYDGKVVYEGELGIVIGKKATAVSEEEADGYIFGYTCVNDITAAASARSGPWWRPMSIPPASSCARCSMATSARTTRSATWCSRPASW